MLFSNSIKGENKNETLDYFVEICYELISRSFAVRMLAKTLFK